MEKKYSNICTLKIKPLLPPKIKIFSVNEVLLPITVWSSVLKIQHLAEV